MDTKQLYAGGKAFKPVTTYEENKTPEKIQEMEVLLNLLADKVANQLLQKTDIAAWAKQPQKPSYNAAEVGADASGSASGALAAAKEYADSTYMQATGYTDAAIAGLINGAPTTLDTLGEIAAAMLEHENVVDALNAAIGSKASEVEYQAHAGNGTVHVTASDKEALAEAVSGVEELRAAFRDGCSVIADKLTACGAETVSNASPEDMAEGIQQIYDSRYSAGAGAAKVGTATADKVVTGYTFTNAQEIGQDGSMPNHGAVSKALDCGGSYTIPKGYHNGSGKVTANALKSQTSATAAAANITKGKTAWVNGVKVTGTGADNTTNYNNGYAAGRTQGQKDVKDNPSGYGLGVTKLGTITTAAATYTVPAGTTLSDVLVVVESIILGASGNGAWAGGEASKSGALYTTSISGNKLTVTPKPINCSGGNVGAGGITTQGQWMVGGTCTPQKISVYLIN